MRKIKTAALFALLLTLLVACASAPEASQHAGQLLKDRIASVRTDVENIRAAYAQRLDGGDLRDVASFSDEERHVGEFAQADAKLAQVQSDYDTVIKPMLDDYKVEQQMQLDTTIIEANRLLDVALEHARQPALWGEYLQEVRRDTDGIVATAIASPSASSDWSR